MFDHAHAYRRAVDERLFRLGHARYDALMDTLVQLRQPQLSKQPDEARLSNALTEALPPLAPDLLGDVADALGRLEEDRRQLREFEDLEQAVGRFDRRYRTYAGTQARRQARGLRQAQTEFDNASRTLNQAQAASNAAHAEEEQAKAAEAEAERALSQRRARLETLRSDPTMQEANRLEGAAKETSARRQEANRAGRALDDAAVRLERARDETARYASRMEQSGAALARLRRDVQVDAAAAGLDGSLADNPISALDAAALVGLPAASFEAARTALRTATTARREQVGLVRRRLGELAPAHALHAQRLQARQERRHERDGAAERRDAADAGVERQGRVLVEAWDTCFAGLRQMQVDADGPMEALLAWVSCFGGGDTAPNPAEAALQAGQQRANLRLAERRHHLGMDERRLDEERQALAVERQRLEAGEDDAPPAPHTRDPAVRLGQAGAPLWQLVEFQDGVRQAERAGLEAALEAAGLLDAWIAPTGRLRTADGGGPLHDVQVLPRTRRPGSLTDWLRPAPGAAAVPGDLVERMLAGIACGPDDPAEGEAWIAPDGRFRLAGLAGAWAKPAAVHIGFAARAAARADRLREIAARLDALAEELARLGDELDQHAAAERQLAAEWRNAPSDQALRDAHAAAAAAVRDHHAARERSVQADRQHAEAETALRAANQMLVRDAADLRLPAAAEGLAAVETALGGFGDGVHALVQAANELRVVAPEHERQLAREVEARDDVRQREGQLAAARIAASEADARLTALRGAVGAKVEDLQRQLADAARAVTAGEQVSKAAGDRARRTGEGRAIAGERAAGADRTLAERTGTRLRAVALLQRFAATGLISAALPEIELPSLNEVWTIDPVLTLARPVEQALSETPDDDEVWDRVQRRTAEDFAELQRALTALGHRGQAEQNDFGMIVTVVYQNRPQRPDQLAAQLGQDIAQRRELLSANEREVLENHLQAEIAAEVQRLLQAAERRVDAVNAELHKRPTSTGVRYRLQWLPLAEGGEGAPAGLDAARKRLLNTGTALWSAEDRRVVGAMLQQRIEAERERADAAGDGALQDQLARALDYRRWHEFRVQRWQDGQWRKLSGPASSGERALGLTVPLFAAVASFYGRGGHAHAPRLVLLDEAFAGIDDASRGHCMARIRAFDLDFVITSEREWACYAELPGVAICHLHKREGIDAVFVSRWTWDGRAKRREGDPDRRAAPA